MPRSPTSSAMGGTITRYLPEFSPPGASLPGVSLAGASFALSAAFSVFIVSSQADSVFSSSSVPRNFLMCSLPSSFSFFCMNKAIHSAFFSKPTLDRSGGFVVVDVDSSAAAVAAFFVIPAASIEWHELHLYFVKIGAPSGGLAAAQATPLRATTIALLQRTTVRILICASFHISYRQVSGESNCEATSRWVHGVGDFGSTRRYRLRLRPSRRRGFRTKWMPI